MATKPIAQAYIDLGFRTHHGLMEDATATPWTLLERAAEATWPSSSQSTHSFVRTDWDAIWGSYDAVTDLASPFVLELIKAYLNAEVVVVQRDFESWWPSFQSEILNRVLDQPMAFIYGFICWQVMGLRAVHAMRKIYFGFYSAKSKKEIIANSRQRYDEYYAEIRQLVPPERRHEYTLGDGWGPLCKFLGVEEPVEGTPFPRLNDTEAHMAEAGGSTNKILMSAVKLALPWVVLGGGVFMFYVYR
ncbi:hypothetical protein LSUE1_G001566 [Lachnellula suecica]|uniref:Uncharacterized protein n=1 Tax=Lachnellula suecica TaxID=602035 RepID=A0A8T9CD49_9HELO|nr:hypothetical protein LSUE1_G001566 [Lachnellula suecica]